MLCKVRKYQFLPDPKNPGKPIKANENINHIIYDETMYFPTNYQKLVYTQIKHAVDKSRFPKDLENRMNDLIAVWKLAIGLTIYKPLFPKENLGVLIGDPFFNYY